eukprot:4367623-Alexandrium_andersonii.AAC.1
MAHTTLIYKNIHTTPKYKRFGTPGESASPARARLAPWPPRAWPPARSGRHPRCSTPPSSRAPREGA